MPEQKDMSDPCDWDNDHLTTEALFIARENYFDFEKEYLVIKELVERFMAKSNGREFK